MNHSRIKGMSRWGMTCPLTEGFVDLLVDRGLAELRRLPFYPMIQSRSKYELVDMVLTVMGVAFEEASKWVPELQEEIAPWNEGRRCAMGVLPKGPHITLEKRGDRIRFLGKGRTDSDVAFLFKNLDAAVLVLTAQMSAHQAMAECRIILDGRISHGMEMNRALTLVETYLFPEFILEKILKRAPHLNAYQLITKGTFYAALMPALVKTGLKGAIHKVGNWKGMEIE